MRIRQWTNPKELEDKDEQAAAQQVKALSLPGE